MLRCDQQFKELLVNPIAPIWFGSQSNPIYFAPSMASYTNSIPSSISKLKHNVLSLARRLFISHFSSSTSQLFVEVYNRDRDKLSNNFNSTIIRLGNQGPFTEAFNLFCLMHDSNIKPTKFALCSILNSCCKAQEISFGVQIHALILLIGCDQNIFLASKLVHMYSSFGAVLDAKKVFDGMTNHDLVTWTSIISGFSQNGCGREALLLFMEMLETGIRPNSFTLASVVNASTSLGDGLEHGKLLHAIVIKLGFELNTHVVCTLIDLYAKLGEIGESKSVFDAALSKDTVLYNSMISGYSQNMLAEEALKLFVEMQEEEMTPSISTFSSLLNACGRLAALPLGKQLHSFITKMGSDRNVFVLSSLLDMYSKCGSIYEACYIFDKSSERNNILWTSMITGYAHNGRGASGLKLFDQFVREGGKPDNICFTSVLTACHHAGLLDEGSHYFNLMTKKYGLVPNLDQYTCMVGLYGRTGHLSEAKKMMEIMPFKPNAVMLSSFLASCRLFGEIELAMEVAVQLFDIDPNSAAPYITLANSYAGVEMWKEAAKVRKMMRLKGVGKSIGWSWVELDSRVHMFSVSDTSHPLAQEIYLELDKVTLEMRESGYPYVVLDAGSIACDSFGEHR